MRWALLKGPQLLGKVLEPTFYLETTGKQELGWQDRRGHVLLRLGSRLRDPEVPLLSDSSHRSGNPCETHRDKSKRRVGPELLKSIWKVILLFVYSLLLSEYAQGRSPNRNLDTKDY